MAKTIEGGALEKPTPGRDGRIEKLPVANLKVQRDYYKAMAVVLQRTQAQLEDDEEEESRELHRDAESLTKCSQTGQRVV
jgi:hypothetical protein